MLTQPISASVANPKVGSICYSAPDQFRAVTGHAGLVASEFSYQKDEEIYGEDEPAEYVYQVICGSVRSYKLLSDGRRQIGAFYLPGDVFGLESGATHRLTAGGRYHGASGETTQSRTSGRYQDSSRPEPLGNDRW